ncbi:hypothetical protein OA264_02185 [Alphaproteobacteria bacterium]|nr:hypothetical protein [Alphaproteobacteria bacterium]
MKRIYYLEKYKDFLTIKIRFLLVNFLILTSLCFVVLKNIDKLRYKVIFDENGQSFTLDRLTHKIKAKR